jgi:SAM-dependent methyltransferase
MTHTGSSAYGSVSFDRAASFYDQTRGFPPGIEAGVAAAFVEAGALTRETHALEVGIGTGRIALPLAPHVGRIVGIDISAAMLERLVEKRTGEAVFPVVADATRLPFADGSIPVVIAVHIFHLLPYAEALREIARVLAPGGVLLHGWGAAVTFPNLMAAWNRALPPENAMRASRPWQTHERYIEAEGWRRVRDDVFYPYTEQRAPVDYLRSLEQRLWSQTWALSDDALNAGIAAVREALATDYADPAEPLAIEQQFRVEVFAPPR